MCAPADSCSLPTGVRHWGEKSTLQRGLPKSERETLWHITHALSLLLDKDFPDGVSNYAQTT